MAIKSVKVLNVMAFQRLWRKNNGTCRVPDAKAGDSFCEAFQLQFCDGINILIGENGVGKTTLLKMIYAAAQWSAPKKDAEKTQRLVQFFSSNLSDTDLLKNAGGYSYFEVSDGTHKFTYSLSHKSVWDFDEWLGLNISSVFIPTMEMLSHSQGFLALNQKYKLPFDGTQVDIIVNASLPETRELPDYMERILDKISNVIDGTIIVENDIFYLLKKDGRKIDFSLEAEGLRKLGLLWKLIRNGLLEKGTVLLWDEPEANLNPELFPLIVDILLELEDSGIQIFIATHSYNLAKYFELRRKNDGRVQYHNLYKYSSEVAEEYDLFHDSVSGEEGIFSKSAYFLSELKGNRIVDADDKLLDEALKKNLMD